MRFKIHSGALAFIGIILVAFALRIYKLGDRSLWFDEASIYYARSLVFDNLLHPSVIINRMLDSNCFSCVYLTLMSFWSLIGKSEALLRMPSVLFGVMSVSVLYLICKRLFNEKIALLSALLLCINPFQIYYSQEASPYALIVLLALCCAYFYIGFLQTGRTRFLVAYCVFSIVNLYIHITTILIILCAGVYFLIYFAKFKHLLKKWILCNFILAVLALHLIFLVFLNKVKALLVGGSIQWLDLGGHISAINIFYTIKNFVVGYNAYAILSVAAVTLSVFVILLGLFRLKEREGVVFVALYSIMPVMLGGLVSLFVLSYVDRYFITSGVFFICLVAAGLSNLKKAYIVAGCIIFFVFSALALKNYYSDNMPGSYIEHVGVEGRKDYRSAASFIRNNIADNDLILHTCENTVVPFKYYLSDIDMIFPVDQVIGSDKSGAIKVYFFSKDKDVLLERPGVKIPDFKNVFVVVSSWNNSKELNTNLAVTNLLEKKYHLSLIREFKGINVYVFKCKK